MKLDNDNVQLLSKTSFALFMKIQYGATDNVYLTEKKNHYFYTQI